MPPFHEPHQPHDDFWIHVFINPEAADIIKSGKGIYPEGTIILKQKFLDAGAKQTEFYTGMRKREKYYNPDYGDWEFFTLDSTATKVTARGKIDSCMDCHANWKETDFVSRKYLRPTPAAPVTR
ncbi:MAG TPA: cytochrome P460 family protein [Verrucomicrobiae bacterium]|nr:cytochrome P460 family protein [Verrucomicrobiae bacterium]